MVIKVIRIDTSEEELITELKNQNFNIKLVERFGPIEKPMPICMVILFYDDNLRDIYESTNLFYVKIRDTS